MYVHEGVGNAHAAPCFICKVGFCVSSGTAGGCNARKFENVRQWSGVNVNVNVNNLLAISI